MATRPNRKRSAANRAVDASLDRRTHAITRKQKRELEALAPSL
jgi:hypothetical protein